MLPDEFPTGPHVHVIYLRVTCLTDRLLCTVQAPAKLLGDIYITFPVEFVHKRQPYSGY